MIPQGLQFLYLPPFSIIARFFLTALAFLNFFSLLLLLQYFLGSFNLSPTVHTFTLGFMAMTMVGALFQMLPVVAGALIEEPLKKATFVHTFLTLGILFLVGGLFFAKPFSSLLGLLFLLVALLYIVPLMLYKLYRIKELRDAPRGFKYALFSFLVGIILGTFLVLNLYGFVSLNHAYLFDNHLSFMLWGWTAVLVASVSFQVIEMFFVTPPYPAWISRNLPRLTLLLLVLKALTGFVLFELLLSLLFLVYSYYTVDRLMKRRRAIPDPLVYLWYLSMLFLALSALAYPFREKNLLLFLVLFGIFVLSVIMAMMYRIIPFLVWMHLTTQGVPKAPTMYRVIDQESMWLNFYTHLSFIVSLAFLVSGIPLMTALFLFVNTALFLYFITKGVLVYVKYRKA
ncbi:MAG: hypothetical protein GXN96_03250 [Aquificae bacterium]|nr:hypothetical protein [Aquificota bacterium]